MVTNGQTEKVNYGTLCEKIKQDLGIKQINKSLEEKVSKIEIGVTVTGEPGTKAKVTDSGVVGMDAAKAFFGTFKTLSEADAEWK